MGPLSASPDVDVCELTVPHEIPDGRYGSGEYLRDFFCREGATDCLSNHTGEESELNILTLPTLVIVKRNCCFGVLQSRPLLY